MRVIFLMCGKGHKQSKKCFILFVPSFSFAILYLLSISVNYRYNDNAIGFNQLTFPVSSTINKAGLLQNSYASPWSKIPFFKTNMIVSKVILKKSSNLSAVKSALKIILMWNAWSTKMEDKPLMKGQCQVRSCLFTTDMSLLEKSDIVVFHFDTLEDYPLNRKSHQRFVFFHFESPDNTALTLMDDPRIRYNYFNWTMTYRRDSDIFLRDFYGSLIAKTKTNNNTRASRYNYDKFKNHKPTFIEQNYVDALIRRKTKMVTWFVGHCQTPIRREEYVRQLSQYVSVDVFGSCTKKCPYHCDEMLRADYKFYLAFENSWCPDYVTEKFIRPYVYDAVPIVLGGANYSNFAPSYSYINVKDFKSPKELADYLILLDKSDKLYAQYFNWKREYDVSTLDMHGWCELCRMANDNSMPTKVYHDIKKWWLFEAGECKTNSSNYF